VVLTHRSWRRIVPIWLGLLVAVAAGLAGQAPATLAGPAGRIENPRLSDAANGTAMTTFPAGTRVVYLNFDYRDMESHQILLRVQDGTGNELFTATRSLSGAGAAAIPIDSLIVVDRMFDALEAENNDLLVAIDNALNFINDPGKRYQHTQVALFLTSQMRTTTAALRGLPLPADALTALDRMATLLAQAQAEGLAAFGSSATDALPHLQAMRAHAVDLLVAVRDARAKSGGGSYPFPPTVDCQPYQVNVLVNAELRETLELAVGNQGAVTDLRLQASRPVIHPGVAGYNSTALTVTALDARCQPAADGTVVTFAVSPATLASVYPVTTTLKSGAASAVLYANSAASGDVAVTAEAGGARAAVVVTLAGTPRSVALTVAQRLLAPGQQTTLTARVTDPYGRAAPNGTLVTFAVSAPTRGQVAPAVVATTGGLASSVLTAGPESGDLTVTAASAGTASSVVVTVVGGSTVPPLPTPGPIGGPPAPIAPTAVPGQARPPCPGQWPGVLCGGSLTLQSYHDDACDRRYDRAWDRPVANVPVSVVFPNGYVESVTTSAGGFAQLAGINLVPGQQLQLIATLPSGLRLCYNSRSQVSLDAGDFSPTRHASTTFRTTD
jgi:hypothetical protein